MYVCYSRSALTNVSLCSCAHSMEYVLVLYFLKTTSHLLTEILLCGNNKRAIQILNKKLLFFLLFLCVVSNAVMVERSKHLNTQNSIEQEEKQQEDGYAPDLFPGSPAKQKRDEKAFVSDRFIHLQLSINCVDHIKEKC